MPEKRKQAKKAVPRRAPRTPSKRKRTPSKAVGEGPVTLAEAQRLAVARIGAAPAAKAVAKAVAADATLAEVGRERRRLAQRNRAELRERIRLYEETYAVMQRRGVKGLAPKKPGAKKPAAKAPPAPLRILAEGDSWFDYPVPFFGGGLVWRLERKLGLPILSSAEAGDEVRFMLGVEQRQKLEGLLARANQKGKPWDVLLFSGGGNDIVGEPLCLWIQRWAAGVPPHGLIDRARFDAALAIVRAGYEDLIALRDRMSPHTRLVFHGYDFALPTGKGLCHFGPWLKPAFDYHGFPDLAAGAAVVRELLTRFARILTDLAATDPARITVITTQGTLDGRPDRWHNELHPNQKGFDAFVKLFAAELRALYPGRFP